jgi:hypothetical protein
MFKMTIQPKRVVELLGFPILQKFDLAIPPFWKLDQNASKGAFVSCPDLATSVPTFPGTTYTPSLLTV